MAVSTISATGLAGSVSQLGKNLVQNGAMTVSQRGTITGQGGTDAYTAIDRVLLTYSTGESRVTTSQDSTAPSGFSYSLKMDCTTIESAVAAGELLPLQTRIEAQDVQHLDYGAATAKTTTLSFWFRSPKTGIHCVALRQGDATRTFIREFTIASADTFEYFSVTFPGDTGGTITNDTGPGLMVRFPLIAGGNYQGAANSWVASNIFGTSNQQNLLDDAANNVYITGVQLEVGSVATDFEHEDIGTTLDKCLRYYWRQTRVTTGDHIMPTYNTATTTSEAGMRQSVEMRGAPVLSVSAAGDFAIRDTGGEFATTSISLAITGHTQTTRFEIGVSGGGLADLAGGQLLFDATAGGYMALSAEL